MINGQKDEVNQFKLQNSSLNDENSQLKEKLVDYDKSSKLTEDQLMKINDLNARIKKLNEENVYLKIQHESLSRQYERKIKEVNEADFACKLTKAENDQLKKELGELDDKYRDNLKEFKTLDERWQSSQVQLLKLQALSDERNEKIIDLENELVIKTESLKACIEEYEKEKEKGKEMKGQIQVLKDEVRRYQMRQKEFEDMTVDQKNKLEFLTSSELDVQTKLDNLFLEHEAKRNEWRVKEQNFMEEIKVLQSDQELLKEEINQGQEKYEMYVKKSTDNINELKEEIESLKVYQAELQDENSTINKYINEQKAQSQKELQEFKQRFEHEKHDLEFELNDKRVEVEDLKNIQKDLNNNLTLTQAKLQVKEAQTDSLKKANDEIKIEYEEFRHSALAKEKEYNVSIQKAIQIQKELDGRKDRFNAELNKLKKQLEDKELELKQNAGQGKTGDGNNILPLQTEDAQNLLNEKVSKILQLEREINQSNKIIQNMEIEHKALLETLNNQTKELDKIFLENDQMKEKLMKIQQKFNLEEVEQQINLAKMKDQQMNRAIQMVQELYNFIENLVTCTICSDLYSETFMMLPCNHNFCQNCYLNGNKGKKDRCTECKNKIEMAVPNTIIDDIVERYNQKKSVLIEILNQDIFKKKF